MNLSRFIGRTALCASFAFAAGAFAAGSVAVAQDQPKPPPPGAEGGPEGEGPGAHRERGGRRGNPGAMLDRLKSAVYELQLSDEQKGKVDQVFSDAAEEFKKLREETQGKEPRERMAAFRPALERLREGVTAALTEEQRQALRSKMEAARGAGGNLVERIRNSLRGVELTAEQQEKVDALLKETEQKAEAIRAEAQSGAQQARGKFRELMQETRQKVDALLTPEQHEKRCERRRGPEGRRGKNRPGDAPPGDAPSPPGASDEPL